MVALAPTPARAGVPGCDGLDLEEVAGETGDEHPMNDDAKRQLLEALAQHYAGAEFTARSAAADLDPAL
jgi:hypothetical protein